MKHLGIFCLPGRGHLYPAVGLGRKLVENGYNITVFGHPLSKALIRAAGLDFCLLATSDVRSTEALPPNTASNGPNTLSVMHQHALSVLADGRRLLTTLHIDGLLVDQTDLATGSVAQLLGIPFVTISFCPPVYLTDLLPPFLYAWPNHNTKSDLARNHRGNMILTRLLLSTMRLVNQHRSSWGLPHLSSLNEFFSTRAIISQMPAALEFTNDYPSFIHHTGPFYDVDARSTIPFDWSRLNDCPLIYASMGTVRNNSRLMFETIAKACEGIKAQLVLSLGGMHLMPTDFKNLPGAPIVVHYAPQRELLKLAGAFITHCGMNSILEAATNGVPTVMLPLTDDQPGIAARVRARGAGLILDPRHITAHQLSECVEEILSDPTFRRNAQRLSSSISSVDALELASTLVTQSLFEAQQPRLPP